ncbi:hypothetical protein ABZP36_026120 [Zizania latifolia]
MECNRDDAIRSKEIAERKFSENDIDGAKKFALKGKALFESLEGIDQMISALDVHKRAQTKINGENDWYGILEVSTLDDDDKIKRQYKRLALQTHPDKNSFSGAEGAFKLISDAWSVLSDKDKRRSHDQKRFGGSLRVHHNRFQANGNGTSSSAMSGMNGVCFRRVDPAPTSNAHPSFPVPKTFWTCCSSCHNSLQYSRQYISQYQDRQRHEPARKEEATGANVARSEEATVREHEQAGSSVGSSNPAAKNVHRKRAATKETEAAQRRCINHNNEVVGQSTSSAAEGDSGPQMHPAKRRPCSSIGTSEAKKRKMSSDDHSHQSSGNAQNKGNVHAGLEKKEKTWKWTKPEIHNVYMRRNRKEHIKEPEMNAVGADSSNQNLDGKHSCLDQGPSCEMPVPEADFYTFGDHSECSFQNCQIWAAYDEEDAENCSEFGTSNWISYGYSKTCGNFTVGALRNADQLNTFSHIVAWEKGPGGIIRIFPKKGDIWALYQNWSPDWNMFTPDDTIYKYDLVQVLDNYNPSKGISVTPMVKVPGFVSVFKPFLDPMKSKMVLKEEMLRFSHQVPFHVLTGQEAKNSPKGCYELDPGSIPKELLQVIPQFDGVK